MRKWNGALKKLTQVGNKSNSVIKCIDILY